MAAKWLSPTEAARRLGVSESTVWRFLRRELMPSVKVGGQRRIPVSALRQVPRAARRVLGPKEIPIFGLDDAIFQLAGRFRSEARGPGSADKHAHLRTKA